MKKSCFEKQANLVIGTVKNVVGMSNAIGENADDVWIHVDHLCPFCFKFNTCK